MAVIEKYLDESGVAYPPWQREYFLTLYRQHLLLRDRGGVPVVDLTDPSIHFFTSMDPLERAEYVFDLSSVEERLRFEERAKGLKIAVLEMNGGLGTSLGLDPKLHQAKATGVTFHVPLDDGRLEPISILEAKFLWMIRNSFRVGQFGLIPWNSEITKASWDAVLARPFLDDVIAGVTSPRSYRDVFFEHGITLFDHEIQFGFPRLVAGSETPFTEGRLEDRYAPGGHGQVLYQLYYSGALARLSDEGFHVLALVNADGKSAKPNPLIASLMVERGIPGAMVTTDRTAIDAKGGISVVRDGKIELVELSQVSSDQHNLFQEVGLRALDGPQPFNTNTIYIHLRRFFDVLGEVQMAGGVESIRELLTPELIVVRKRVQGEEKTAVEVDQLEGAVGSVILKLPGVKLFNVDLAERTSEFTPVKKPHDVVYLYDSDAFRFDPTTGELVSRIMRPPAQFDLSGWEGWDELHATRAAFGKPSMMELHSLTIRGEVALYHAYLRGRVIIENMSARRVDLHEVLHLPRKNGRLLLADVLIRIGEDHAVTIKKLAPSFC